MLVALYSTKGIKTFSSNAANIKIDFSGFLRTNRFKLNKLEIKKNPVKMLMCCLFNAPCGKRIGAEPYTAQTRCFRDYWNGVFSYSMVSMCVCSFFVEFEKRISIWVVFFCGMSDQHWRNSEWYTQKIEICDLNSEHKSKTKNTNGNQRWNIVIKPLKSVGQKVSSVLVVSSCEGVTVAVQQPIGQSLDGVYLRLRPGILPVEMQRFVGKVGGGNRGGSIVSEEGGQTWPSIYRRFDFVTICFWPYDEPGKKDGKNRNLWSWSFLSIWRENIAMFPGGNFVREMWTSRKGNILNTNQKDTCSQLVSAAILQKERKRALVWIAGVQNANDIIGQNIEHARANMRKMNAYNFRMRLKQLWIFDVISDEGWIILEL